jgi:hypothetical protein
VVHAPILASHGHQLRVGDMSLDRRCVLLVRCVSVVLEVAVMTPFHWACGAEIRECRHLSLYPHLVAKGVPSRPHSAGE